MPTPYQYQQPGQGTPTAPWGSTQWSYPPRPEHYQGGTLGQQGTMPGGSPTGPFSGGAPGHFTQPHNAFGQSFHSAATTPVAYPGVPTPTPRRSGLRTGTLILLIALLALVFGTGLFAGWQFGRNGSAGSPTSNSSFQPGNSSTVTIPTPGTNNADAIREAVISKVQPGIVQINVVTGSQQALGSGVIIDGRGYIVTNSHVVSGASSIQVTLANNQTLPAQLTGMDTVDDLAVIKITPPAGGLTTVTMGDSSQLRIGQEVLAIGSPLGNSETVTSGIISALNRNVSEGQNGPTLPDAIQTDAPINPGNSGGALVDLQGNLIGMPTLNAVDTEFNTPANGLGFAIPVNRIRYIAQQLITSNHVTHTGRAILGVTVTTVTPTLATQNHLNVSSGVLVVNVSSGGPSDSAGIKAGDVIVQLGNKTINSTNDVSAALLQQKPGDSVPVKIYRGSQQLTINVTLGELAAG
jgi:S1-C subfamily serine protease